MISWMPWGIQKIQKNLDFLDAVKNPENPGLYRGESRKSKKSRIAWMPYGIQKIQDFLDAVGDP